MKEPRIATGDMMTEDEIWKMQSEGPELPLMPKPCGDCAVVDGFYMEPAESLIQQPDAIREAVSKRWYCHNCPGKACRGNADFQGFRW